MICCFMWSGSLRSCEILTATTRRFVKGSTLMNKDVKIQSFNGTTVLILTLHNTKEMQSNRKETMVELFENQMFNCPVAAFKAWRLVCQAREDQPLVSLGGQGYTRSQLNKTIRELLEPVMEYDEATKVLSHSFRAGLASSLARIGASEEEIKRQGRWSSDSYAR